MDLEVRNIKKERNTNKNKKGEKARMGVRAAIIGAERERNRK